MPARDPLSPLGQLTAQASPGRCGGRAFFCSRALRRASTHAAISAGATGLTGGAGRALPGVRVRRHRHAFTFAPVHLDIQRDIRWSFFMVAPMQQIPLPILCRLDAPSVVHPQLVARCATYREAVRLCWEHRKVRNMTLAMLAERAGLYAPHVTQYLRDGKHRRDLPGSGVAGFQRACDNAAISQWLALQGGLTVNEELQCLMQAARAAA